MSRCSAFKSNGKQCIRSSSRDNHLYCWQHQQHLKTYISGEGFPHKDPISFTGGYLDEPIYPSRNLSILSGVTKFNFYPDVNGKRILLLGEYHDKIGLCPYYFCHNKPPGCYIYDVDEWLADLARDAPECLDIFVEQPVLINNQSGGGNLIIYDSGLDAVIDKFKKCNVILKQEACYSDNLRYHYIDFRRLLSGELKINSSMTDYYLGYYGGWKNWSQILWKIDLKYTQLGSTDHERKILSYVINLDHSQSSQELYEQYMRDLLSELKQEMEESMAVSEEYSYNKNKDVRYLKQFHSRINKEMSKMDPSIDKKKFLETVLDVYLDDESMSLGDRIFLIPMDLYVLTRLFIHFDEEKMTRGPLGCRNNSMIKNAIIYGGQDHIDNYAEFIRRFYDIEPEIDIELDREKKCIEFSEPFDFFEKFDEI